MMAFLNNKSCVPIIIHAKDQSKPLCTFAYTWRNFCISFIIGLQRLSMINFVSLPSWFCWWWLHPGGRRRYKEDDILPSLYSYGNAHQTKRPISHSGVPGQHIIITIGKKASHPPGFCCFNGPKIVLCRAFRMILNPERWPVGFARLSTWTSF